MLISNNVNALRLYNWLGNRIPTYLWSNRIDVDLLKTLAPKLVVSYNYRHIIKQDCIDFMNGRMINMHISFLPWNRGSSPNVWSFIENSPKGVTIHRVSAGLDEGDILLQEEVKFDIKRETFQTTYQKLNEEIVRLFTQNFDKLITNTITPIPQDLSTGSYHTMSDLKKLRNKVDFS